MRISDWSSDVCSSDLKDAEVSKYLGGVRDEATTRTYITDNMAHWDEYGFGTWALRDGAGTFAGRCALRHITINDVDEVGLGYTFHTNRKRVVEGTSGAERGNLGGRRTHKKKKK